jgi:hypothetical protein
MTTRHAIGRRLIVTAAISATALAGAATAAAAPAPHAPAPHAPAPHAPAPHAPAAFKVRQLLNGMKLEHSFVPSGTSKRRTEHLSSPDDITVLGHHLFTAFQNGVGPQGQPSPDGNTDSTIVEFTAAGQVVHQWDVHGKCDGLTADPATGVVFATVNEDANSSIYWISPFAVPSRQVLHFRYNKPLPHFGGTDAISVDHGQVLVSASAPGTTGKAAPQPTYPAVYRLLVELDPRVVDVSALFYDEASAAVANAGPQAGKVVRLGLTDPDSNEIVPAGAPRFAGDFMLTSQGDKEQIFVLRKGTPGSHLAVLRLANSVDDTAWVRSRSGRLYASSTSEDAVDIVTGEFRPGTVLVAVTPCDANNAPATCPGPGFPPNYLGSLDEWTGAITRVPVTGAPLRPQGMVFVSPGWKVAVG